MSNHKVRAVDFLNRVVAGNIREAYQQYAAPNFRHHNAYFPGDAESLCKGMEESHKQFPAKDFAIKHVIGEGDLVAVHSLLKLMPDHAGITVVHIFRFAGDRIVEFWDVAHVLPTTTPNLQGVI